MKTVIRWLKVNTVRIPAAVSTLLGLAVASGTLDLTVAQIGSAAAAVGVFLGLLTSTTVTANARLNEQGKALGKFTGLDPPKVSEGNNRDPGAAT